MLPAKELFFGVGGGPTFAPGATELDPLFFSSSALINKQAQFSITGTFFPSFPLTSRK